MAEGTKLVLTFETNEDKNMTISFNYAKPTATSSQVNTLMDAIITNNSIFENIPTVKKSAKIVTTTETVFDLSNLSRAEPYTIPEAFEKGLVSADEYLESCAGLDVEPDTELMKRVAARQEKENAIQSR